MNDAQKIGYIAASVLTLVTAWASYDAFSTASFIMYDNPFIIPIATTLVIAFISFGGMIAYPWLEKAAEWLIARIRTDFESADELETESWRKE